MTSAYIIGIAAISGIWLMLIKLMLDMEIPRRSVDDDDGDAEGEWYFNADR